MVAPFSRLPAIADPLVPAGGVRRDAAAPSAAGGNGHPADPADLVARALTILARETEGSPAHRPSANDTPAGHPR